MSKVKDRISQGEVLMSVFRNMIRLMIGFWIGVHTMNMFQLEITSDSFRLIVWACGGVVYLFLGGSDE